MIRSQTSRFEAEVRISPWLIIAALLALDVVLSLASDILLPLSTTLTIVLPTSALLAVTLLLTLWEPWLGRWLIVLTLTSALYLLNYAASMPETLTLLWIPTVLAAALISLPAAGATAVAETTFLPLWARYAPGARPATIGVSVVAIWASLGVMAAVYRPVFDLAGWCWDHFQRTRGELDEVRSRRAEFKQAMADLAHVNRQLALTNERLQTARLVAEEAQRTKAAFVAKVSHEFRTPLNIIIGLIDLLLEAPDTYGKGLPPALFEDLEIVRRNCEHLSEMINDILDLSQAEAGRLALHKERVDLAEAIHGAVAAVWPLLEKKSLRLDLAIPADLPQVYCDRTRIRQVILNLLSNAARYTEHGGITVKAVQQDQHITVSVADTGPGISPEDGKKLFEPFYRSSRTAQRSRGSGLGLSISKQFIELHDGQMWFESQLGVGSTFLFRLPISPPMQPVTGPGRWVAEAWTWIERTSRADLPISLPSQRIIVCDRTGLLYSLLSHHVDEVELVDTRDLAQVRQELVECPAEAVLLNTPPGSLQADVEQARQEIPDTPIIGCCLPPSTEQEAVAYGAIGRLTKPVARATLQGAIQKVGRPVKRVLVVDDEIEVQQLFKRMLCASDEGLEVTTVSNGSQALAALRANPFDLVLLDIALPDIDGWQVLTIKSDDVALKDIPVILISAKDPREQPPVSPLLVATMGEGVSLSRLFRCSRALSALLLQPDAGPDPKPE